MKLTAVFITLATLVTRPFAPAEPGPRRPSREITLNARREMHRHTRGF